MENQFLGKHSAVHIFSRAQDRGGFDTKIKVSLFSDMKNEWVLSLSYFVSLC